eukprot:XP_003727023.1 PREDICTED: uncharacterized protein LOC100888971 isoform X1 [Strongylocentrotus purpuratus]
MTRMFKRWISLLVCMFLPTMMFSFLYHRNEILQKKIANSIQLDQRLFPKSLPADETSGSILQRLVFPTPYYRVERDLDEQMWLPMSMSGMASREVIRSTLTRKKMITTRTAIEVHSSRETKETLGTAERNVIIATGNDVSGAEKPSKDIKKRPSKRSRRTNKRSPVHPQELPQQVREVKPITSVGVAGKFNDKQMIPTPAPVARVPSFQNNIEEFAEVSEKLDGLTIASHVESVDPVSRTATAAPVKMIRQKVEEVKPIKSVGVAGKVDDKQIIPTSAPVTRVPSFQNNIEEFVKVSEKLDGLAIASHVESVDPVPRTVTAAPVKMIRQPVGEVKPFKSVGVAGKFDDKQIIPTSAPVTRVPSFQNNIEEFAKVSEKLDGLAIASHVESVDPLPSTAAAAPVKMIRQKVEEVKPIKSVGVAGKVDDKQIIPTPAPVTRVPSFQNNIEEFAKVSEKLDGLAIASHVESVDPLPSTAAAAPVKMIRQKVEEVKPIKSVGVAGKVDDKQIIPTPAPVTRVPSFQNNIEEFAKVSEKLDGLAIASHVESVDPGSRTAVAAPAKIVLRLTAETKNITELTEIANDNLDMKSVNETSFGESIQASNLEKPSEQNSPSALSAPTKRKSKKKQEKSKKTNDKIDVQVMNIEQKFDEMKLDTKEKVMNMTDKKDEVVRTMEEQQENNVPVKPPSRKEDTKRKRDRKSRTRHKSHPKEEEVNVPVTLSLNFNLNDSKSHSPVILVSTNKAFLNFTDNWLESVKRSGIRSGVTLVAEDREAFNYLNNRTDIELNVVLNDVSESPGERLLFDSPAYKQLVNKRPSYILQLLSSGHDVLFSDVDIVWLKNPLPYFTNDTNDIWLQEDLHEPTVYCAGFTFYRSSPATIALVTEWVQTLALHPTYPDQRVLNGLLKKKRWQGDYIKRAVMDSRLFPSGRLYFDPDWREANKDTEQVMVHNNWIKGHDRKVERFRNEGLWYLDDKETGQSYQ